MGRTADANKLERATLECVKRRLRRASHGDDGESTNHGIGSKLEKTSEIGLHETSCQ